MITSPQSQYIIISVRPGIVKDFFSCFGVDDSKQIVIYTSDNISLEGASHDSTIISKQNSSKTVPNPN